MSYSCWIIYNGFLKSDKFIDFANMFHHAANTVGDKATIYRNDEILTLIENNLIVNGKQVQRPDYVIFTDKDIYLAKQLEYLHIPVFNSSETIEISDDKIKTYQALKFANIPIPETIVAPKTYGLPIQLDHSYIEYVMDTFGFPLIIKETFGSFGEQVYLIEDEATLYKKKKEIGGKPFMFQKFINTSYGVDVRLQVVGNEVVASMKRVAENDFRANITNGGKMMAYTPNEEEKRVAVQASNAIGAHFSGVDLLFGKNGKPIVCEVNSNAHIRNLYDCTGIDASHAIIEHIHRVLENTNA
ncbi:ATP-grasp domain-containing protein [Pseudogracilibacillus sp. ICA-222130]|uniref:ATP-grasp domain-containing protein n=1 Tax=Pseudogracilibacillus sp. ICA-222130 TaxID=3134655 RepID=UPI0030BCE012